MVLLDLTNNVDIFFGARFLGFLGRSQESEAFVRIKKNKKKKNLKSSVSE